MIILDIVIRITDRGVDAATSYFTFFSPFVLPLLWGCLSGSIPLGARSGLTNFKW